MKKNTLLILVLIVSLSSCNANKIKEWISFKTYFKSDPFIISFINDTTIKFIDSNLDSKFIKLNFVNDKLALLNEGEKEIGKIIFKNENNIEIFFNHLENPIIYFPLETFKHQYPQHSTENIGNILKSVWSLNLIIGNNVYDCKVDFITNKNIIIGYKDSLNQLGNYNLYSWDILDYNSLVILRLFDDFL